MPQRPSLCARFAAHSACREEERGKILCALVACTCVLDVSVVYSPAAMYGSATQCDAAKQTVYACYSNAAFKFVPFSVETHERLGTLCTSSLTLEARTCGRRGPVLAEAIYHKVLQELTVVLCHWNAQIERTGAGFIALADGRAFMPGMARPAVKDGAEAD